MKYAGHLFLYLPSLYFVWKCWNSGLELMTSLLYHHAQLVTCISSLLVFVHFINWIVFWLFNFKVLLIYFGPIAYQILSYSLVCSLIVDICSKLKVFFFLLLIKPCFLFCISCLWCLKEEYHYRGCSSVVRVLAWHVQGPGFNSQVPTHTWSFNVCAT